MTPELAIPLPLEELATFCRTAKIVRLEVFGSILGSQFRADSDIDLLFTMAPDVRISLLDIAKMEIALESILGRRVDLVSRVGIEESENAARREAILASARTLIDAQAA